jgi:Domain of unknown function (DUF6924)
MTGLGCRRVRIAVTMTLPCLLVAGCGDEDVTDAEPQASTGPDPLTRLFRDDATPLLRTDFSDDAAWKRVVQAVTAPANFGEAADPDEGGSEEHTPNTAAVDDRAYAGATVQSLVDASHGSLSDTSSSRTTAPCVRQRLAASSPSSTSISAWRQRMPRSLASCTVAISDAT